MHASDTPIFKPQKGCIETLNFIIIGYTPYLPHNHRKVNCQWEATIQYCRDGSTHSWCIISTALDYCIAIPIWNSLIHITLKLMY